MSYSHTKKRKLIKKLKKKHGKDFFEYLRAKGEEVRKKNDGPLIGSLQDIMDAKS